MDQGTLLPLNELLQSLNVLSYMQLFYLGNTLHQLIVDEIAAMQLLRDQIALTIANHANNASETEHPQTSENPPSMQMIMKSVLKLSQDELLTLGTAVLKRLEQLPSPFPKRDPESRNWGIVYGHGQIFPEEYVTVQPEPPPEIPDWLRQVRALDHQAFQTLSANPEEALRLINEAVALAEQNHFPTFSLKIRWESATNRNEHRIADLFQEAVEFYRMQNDPFELGQKLRDWAFMQARIENRAKALEILTEAEAIFESLTPEALSQKQSRRVLMQNLIENEVLIHTKRADIQRLRKQIQSGQEVRGGYSIEML